MAFIYSLKSFQLCIALHLIYAMTLRLIHIIPHHEMKRIILNATRDKIPDDELSIFAQRLTNSINGTVADICQRAHSNGHATILATAAPAIYADKIASISGFDYCIATQIPTDKNWKEYSGHVKCREVEKIIKDKGYILSCVITDHSDDIPLMELCKKNGGKTILVSPQKATIEAAQTAEIDFILIT